MSLSLIDIQISRLVNLEYIQVPVITIQLEENCLKVLL